MKKKAIIGAGGFARELFAHMKNQTHASKDEITFFVSKKYASASLMSIDTFDPDVYTAIVAIGDPTIRQQVVSELPQETEFFTFIDHRAIILDDDIVIEHGSIICAGCILTTNIKIGTHCQLNLNTTIGHDTIIHDYFTTAPGVHVSGNCNIGNNVYIGTNASIKEAITICDNAVVGLNAGVVKNITESGIYVGTPAKLR